jgi:hypothetical protein
MATLGQYFGSHSGDLAIYLGVFRIGSGRFGAFADFSADFTGSYAVLGQQGKLALAITLADSSPTASAGPCTITLNGRTDNAASYSVEGQKLVCETALNDVPVEIYKHQNGTQIDHVSGHNIWIGPA